MTTDAKFYTTATSRTYRAICAIQERGPLRTSEMAPVMGVPLRRVHAYMHWALMAGAVTAERGRSGKSQTVWKLGDTVVRLRVESAPVSSPRGQLPPRDVWEYAARAI